MPIIWMARWAAAVSVLGAGASIVAALVARQTHHSAVTSVREKINSKEMLLFQFALDPLYCGRTRTVNREHFSPFTGIDDLTFDVIHMVHATNPHGKVRITRAIGVVLIKNKGVLLDRLRTPMPRSATTSSRRLHR